MIDFLRRMFGRGVRDEARVGGVAEPELGLDDDSDDDMRWLLPPSSVTDPHAWDEYWMAQIEHGFAGMADMFVDDRELVAFLHREGLRTGLCVGAGLSLEPIALARAGFDVTVLDLSPFVTRQIESVDPRDEHAAPFLDARQLRDGGLVRCVVGDLQNPDVCPGPYDFVIERRTLQNFPESSRDEAIRAVASRLAERGVLLSHCHDGAWKPPAAPRHAVGPWFDAKGWTRGLPDVLEGRCFLPILTTG